MVGFRNDSYVEARLGRWGRYQRWLNRGQVGGSGMPAPLSSWWVQIVLSPNVQGRGVRRPPVSEPCPLSEEGRIEAGETGRAIGALERDLQEVILEAYYWQGTIDGQVAALGCCRQTYYNRLRRAHAELLDLFNAIGAGLEIGQADLAPPRAA
jgi:hypothetical protein